MYPPKGGAPHYVETGVPAYPQAAGVPQYNQQAFPGQNQGAPAYPQGVPQYNQQAFPGQNQRAPAYPQAGAPQYNQQASPGQNQGAGTEMEWSTGLCGCCEDPGNCCITCCCPCITVGQIAEVLDRGATSCAVGAMIYTALACVGLPCIYSCGFRTKLRTLYSLKEGSCNDCCLHCWCDYCAICQEYRELKYRGVDPSIGWQGNVQKWNRDGSAMPPPVAAGMYR